jgi:hypothetical protein
MLIAVLLTAAGAQWAQRHLWPALAGRSRMPTSASPGSDQPDPMDARRPPQPPSGGFPSGQASRLRLRGEAARANPFHGLGGEWVWTTHERWKTVIWRAASREREARPLAVLQTRQGGGLVVGYTASPDGRWLLYHWHDWQGNNLWRSHWALVDISTGKRRWLPC